MKNLLPSQIAFVTFYYLSKALLLVDSFYYLLLHPAQVDCLGSLPYKNMKTPDIENPANSLAINKHLLLIV